MSHSIDNNRSADSVEGKVADCAQNARSAALMLDSIADQLGDPLARLLEERCVVHADPAISPKLAKRLSMLPNALRDIARQQRASLNHSLEILAELTDNPEVLKHREPLDGSPIPLSPGIDGVKPVALIVDDELLMREVLGDMIEDLGYQVERAENGREAWEKLQQQSIEAVFLDFRMPVMHGFEVAQLISTLNEDERPRVIGMTNSPLPEEHQQGLAEGMDAVLVKPINAEALKTALVPPIGC